MVSRDEVEHVPPGVPCLWESESDMATDECTFRMPTDRKSPYYVDPGPDPTGTPHPSGWLEKWALNFDHAAVTFSETGDPRVEVFAEEKDLLATNSSYVWSCSQAYLEASGYLCMFEPQLRKLGRERFEKNLVATSHDEPRARRAPEPPPLVVDTPPPVDPPLDKPSKDALPDGICSTETSGLSDHGFSVGGAQIDSRARPDESESFPGMMRLGLGNQVAGGDAQAASAKTPADTRTAPAATSTEEETQSDDDAFPSLVRPHIGSLDGRKRVRVTSGPSATGNNSDTA